MAKLPWPMGPVRVWQGQGRHSPISGVRASDRQGAIRPVSGAGAQDPTGGMSTRPDGRAVVLGGGLREGFQKTPPSHRKLRGKRGTRGAGETQAETSG